MIDPEVQTLAYLIDAVAEDKDKLSDTLVYAIETFGAEVTMAAMAAVIHCMGRALYEEDEKEMTTAKDEEDLPAEKKYS